MYSKTCSAKDKDKRSLQRLDFVAKSEVAISNVPCKFSAGNGRVQLHLLSQNSKFQNDRNEQNLAA